LCLRPQSLLRLTRVCSATLVSADMVVLFFFSSRRRHTRFSRDWSSDVCSSDLHDDYGARVWQMIGLGAEDVRNLQPLAKQVLTRSEERRVGKECRSRWTRVRERERKMLGNDGRGDCKPEQVSRRDQTSALGDGD